MENLRKNDTADNSEVPVCCLFLHPHKSFFFFFFWKKNTYVLSFVFLFSSVCCFRL